jgi:hypothetical protein
MRFAAGTSRADSPDKGGGRHGTSGWRPSGEANVGVMPIWWDLKSTLESLRGSRRIVDYPYSVLHNPIPQKTTEYSVQYNQIVAWPRRSSRESYLYHREAAGRTCRLPA